MQDRPGATKVLLTPAYMQLNEAASHLKFYECLSRKYGVLIIEVSKMEDALMLQIARYVGSLVFTFCGFVSVEEKIIIVVSAISPLYFP